MISSLVRINRPSGITLIPTKIRDTPTCRHGSVTPHKSIHGNHPLPSEKRIRTRERAGQLKNAENSGSLKNAGRAKLAPSLIAGGVCCR
jgi:hypothetical protein